MFNFVSKSNFAVKTRKHDREGSISALGKYNDELQFRTYSGTSSQLFSPGTKPLKMNNTCKKIIRTSTSTHPYNIFNVPEACSIKFYEPILFSVLCRRPFVWILDFSVSYEHSIKYHATMQHYKGVYKSDVKNLPIFFFLKPNKKIWIYIYSFFVYTNEILFIDSI